MSDVMQQILTTPIIPNSMAIWGMGQMGVALKTPQTTLYVDLCLSDILFEKHSSVWKRAYDPPIAPGAISKVDYYLISHEHADHLDPMTIAPILANHPDMRFVAPKWCQKLLLDLGVNAANVIYPEVEKTIELPDSDVRLTAVPSAHYEKEYDAEKGYRWLGYMIESNGVNFYHAGDTIVYEDYIETLKRLPTPDIALLPVNGRDYFREVEGPAIGNLLPVEAARLAHDLGWDVLLIGHNDMYPFNTIPYSTIIGALETIAPRQKYKVLQAAELYYYVK